MAAGRPTLADRPDAWTQAASDAPVYVRDQSARRGKSKAQECH